MGETDSENFDKFDLALHLELFDQGHQKALELVLYFLAFVFDFLVLHNERIVCGIDTNGQSRILIDFLLGCLFLDLPKLVFSQQELVSDQRLEFFLSFLHGLVFIEYRNSFSFYIINVKVLLAVVWIDGIEFEEVLFSI